MSNCFVIEAFSRYLYFWPDMNQTFKYFLLCFLAIGHIEAWSQSKVSGVVKDVNGKGLQDVLVRVKPDSIAAVTNLAGRFELNLSAGEKVFIFSHINYKTERQNRSVGSQSMELSVVMQEVAQVLEDVNVVDNAIRFQQDLGIVKIAPRNLEALPSATGDFNKILATLPGVASNNELSSVYSVRGGNYDENLIYVNGIKVYRPQIVSAGRQEGLSFINPDMVRSIEFSAGGWQSKYGDKLSSVLSVDYKQPIRQEATIDLGILGGSLYYGGLNRSGDLTWSMGLRHKNTQYLLGTLETQGQYVPRFTDFQAFIKKRFGDKTSLGVLLSAAINNYKTVPELQQAEFGTLQQSFRLTVGFDGRELLDYHTYQAGAVLTHSFSENIISRISLSSIYSAERENYDIEGGYLLCNLDNNPASETRNQCAVVLGIGTNYSFGRNKLEARIFNVTQSNEVYIGNDLLEFGISWDAELLDDRLHEYEFLDSARYTKITALRDSEIDLATQKIAGYGQYTLASSDSSHVINAGIRLNYWTYSGQLLVSPRVQYAYRFGAANRNLLRAAIGIYQQHPFYRELRDRNGRINQLVRAQSSTHYILGFDRDMTIWGRPFRLTSEAYYKYLWNVNLYDVDNVRIRYFANNDAKAYAAGADFRINGEFVPGTESWFSIGILKTMEDLPNDSRTTYFDEDGNQVYPQTPFFNGTVADTVVTETGYIRRPMDQRLNLGIFFQDHLPNDPTVRVGLNLLYGSGLPFGPPNDDDYRNSYFGDDYARIDVGFSKVFNFSSVNKILPKSLWIGLDILNLLGTENAISYTWIQDVNANQFAVPNALSTRFYNLRVVMKY